MAAQLMRDGHHDIMEDTNTVGAHSMSVDEMPSDAASAIVTDDMHREDTPNFATDMMPMDFAEGMEFSISQNLSLHW